MFIYDVARQIVYIYIALYVLATWYSTFEPLMRSHVPSPRSGRGLTDGIVSSASPRFGAIVLAGPARTRRGSSVGGR